MPEFLLTKEEISRAADADYSPGWWQHTDAQRLNLVAQAALRKIAAYVKQNSVKNYLYGGRMVTFWGHEEFDALMREAGLVEKEAPDA